MRHPLKRVVLTGGPGTGKTAVLELVRQSVCPHVVMLPDSAGIAFGRGFPRTASDAVRRAVQREIFFAQGDLEVLAESTNPAIVLCDRGTVDGAAYWPGPDTLWSSVGLARTDELARYAAVIHLRAPSAAHGCDGTNPVRLETAEDAARIDKRIALEWEGHPRVFFVETTADLAIKARHVLDLVRAELPACCRRQPARISRARTESRIEFAMSGARG